jgi:hypothetical protein
VLHIRIVSVCMIRYVFTAGPKDKTSGPDYRVGAGKKKCLFSAQIQRQMPSYAIPMILRVFRTGIVTLVRK